MKKMLSSVLVVCTFLSSCDDSGNGQRSETTDDTEKSDSKNEPTKKLTQDFSIANFEDVSTELSKLPKDKKYPALHRFVFTEAGDHLSLDEKLSLIAKFSKDTDESAGLYSSLIIHCASDGYDLQELSEASLAIPPGSAKRKMHSTLFFQFREREPHSVWKWLQSGDLEPDQAKGFISSFPREFVKNELKNGGGPRVEQILIKGSNPQEAASLESASMAAAITELGKLGALSEETLSRILKTGREELITPAYRSWISSLPSEELLQTLSLEQFPPSAREAVAITILEQVKDQSPESKIGWVEQNIDDQHQKLRLKVNAYRDELDGTNLITVLESIEEKEVMMELASSQRRMLSNKSVQARVSTAIPRLKELDKFLQNLEEKPNR